MSCILHLVQDFHNGYPAVWSGEREREREREVLYESAT